MKADKHFFDTVRGPIFGGLKQHQVEGLDRIVSYADKWGYSVQDTSYLLATALIETGGWMQPIREGALRFGPSYSDASAKRAVASLKARGIIRTNYALPAGPHQQSYYGRGLVQITWYDNYKKFADLLGIPLDSDPDLALDWDTALDILFLGCRDGMFTGKSLGDYDMDKGLGDPKVPLKETALFQARAIVNGDNTKVWPRLRKSYLAFKEALS